MPRLDEVISMLHHDPQDLLPLAVVESMPLRPFDRGLQPALGLSIRACHMYMRPLLFPCKEEEPVPADPQGCRARRAHVVRKQLT